MDYSKQELAVRWSVSPRTVYRLSGEFEWSKYKLYQDRTTHTFYEVPDEDLLFLDLRYKTEKPTSIEEPFEDPLHAFEVYSHYMRNPKPRALEKTFNLGPKPIALAFVGDVHIGSHEVDYKAVRQQQKVITSTEGMFATQHGDVMNNMLMGRLTDVGALKDESIINQYKIVKHYLASFGPSLLFGISGNHELWSARKIGVDPQKQIYKDFDIPYHVHEATITFKVGSQEYRLHTRHQFKGSSRFHP